MKKLIALLLAAVLILGLCACGDAETAQPETEKEERVEAAPKAPETEKEEEAMGEEEFFAFLDQLPACE